MAKSTMQDMWANSYLGGGNEVYVEQLYETYLKNRRLNHESLEILVVVE